MFPRCEECGSSNVLVVTAGDGSVLHECGLCGAVAGPEAVVDELRLAREARARGVEPRVHAVAAWIAAQPGLEVLAVQGADPELGVLPFVQFAAHEQAGRLSLENLLGSLALSQRQLRLPWSVEAGLVGRLAFTLKPRLAPAAPPQLASAIRQAQADLEVVRRNLLRDMGLSWWRRSR